MQDQKVSSLFAFHLSFFLFKISNYNAIAIFEFFYSFEYKNEAGGDPPDKPANAPDVESDGPKSYSIPVYSTHQLVIENVAFYMEEFRIFNGKHNDVINKHVVEASPVAEQFYSTMSELPDVQQVTSNQASNDEVSSCSDDDNDNASDISDISRTEALQIASFSGKTDIKVTVKVWPLNNLYRLFRYTYIKCVHFVLIHFSKRYRCRGQKCNWNCNWEL